MKKILSVGLSFALVLSAFVLSIDSVQFNYSNATVYAEENVNNEYKNDLFTYSYLPDGTISVDRYIGSDSDVVVPEKINQINVTEINSRCFSKNNTIKSVTIENGIEILHTGAFSDCQKLTKVSMPDSIDTFEDSAIFSGCTNLSDVRLPSKVIKISDSMFRDCINLNSISLNNGLKEIGDGAFVNCSSLKSVSVPETVESIGDKAFGFEINNDEILVNGGFVLKFKCDNDTAEKYAKENGLQYELIHSYKSTIIKPTCKEQGYTLHECSVCGSNYKNNYITATHNYVNSKVVKPTYFSEGYTLKKCNNCGDTIKVEKKAKLKLGTVKSLKVNAASSSSIRLTWSKVKDASGYVLYRYDAAKKQWIKIGRTTKNTFSVKKLQSGKEYKFAVKAYKNSGKKYVYGTSAKITAMTNPSAPKVKASAGKNKAVITWNKVSRATGYKVYFKSSAKGKYKAIKTTSTSKLIKTKLKSGKKYYFAVKAYKKSGKTIRYSNAAYVSIKVK